MRRIVTGVDGQGRSVVVSDSVLPEEGTVTRIWELDPAGPLARWIAAIDPAVAATAIEPARGTSRWVVAQFPPETEERAGRRPPPIPGVDEQGFHTTRTVDYDFVLKGPLILQLDTAAVRLETGDAVVQQATRHAWRNPGPEPALLMAILMSPGKVA